MSLLSYSWLVGNSGFKCRTSHWFLLNFILLVQSITWVCQDLYAFLICHQTYSISLPALSQPPNWYDALRTFIQDIGKILKEDAAKGKALTQESLVNILPYNLGIPSNSCNTTKCLCAESIFSMLSTRTAWKPLEKVTKKPPFTSIILSWWTSLVPNNPVKE